MNQGDMFSAVDRRRIGRNLGQARWRLTARVESGAANQHEDHCGDREQSEAAADCDAKPSKRA